MCWALHQEPGRWGAGAGAGAGKECQTVSGDGTPQPNKQQQQQKHNIEQKFLFKICSESKMSGTGTVQVPLVVMDIKKIKQPG